MPGNSSGWFIVVVSQWLVKAGEPHAAGDPLALIETDKAAVEVEAEEDATLLRRLVAEGQTVEVGSPLALLGSAEELLSDLDALLADLGAPSSEPATTPATAVVEAPGSGASAGPRIFMSPLARKLLKDAGLPADGIVGTGPGGRIRRRDVEAVLSAARDGASGSAGPVGSAVSGSSDRPVEAVSAVAAPAGAASVGGTPVAPAVRAHGAEPLSWREIPHSRLRQAVARRLTESFRDTPHFYLKRSARLDALLGLRGQLNQVSPTKISVNDLLVRAVALAHVAVPQVNAIWTDQAMRQFDTVDVSVAIASEKGLVTPVLRSVEKASISSISAQVKGFVGQAAAGRLLQKDLEGGSITISNLGMYGVEEFAAIINPPQSAILAVGAGRRAPVVVDDEVSVATVVDLVLSADHRVIDGALAAQWMTVLVQTLEDPFRLLV